MSPETLRLIPPLLFAAIGVAVVALTVIAQRRVTKALTALAGELGWESPRRPRLSISLIVSGTWRGRRVAFRYWPPRKGSPPFVAIDLDLGVPGRLELAGRPERETFLTRRISLFGPPEIALFDPADAARFRARGDDPSLAARLFALPGARAELARNLAPCTGDLSLQKGVLRIRRPLDSTAPRISFRRGFALAPSTERVLEVAREEWGLVSAASGLG